MCWDISLLILIVLPQMLLVDLASLLLGEHDCIEVKLNIYEIPSLLSCKGGGPPKMPLSQNDSTQLTWLAPNVK